MSFAADKDSKAWLPSRSSDRGGGAGSAAAEEELERAVAARTAAAQDAAEVRSAAER